jgi:hypothetical protein
MRDIIVQRDAMYAHLVSDPPFSSRLHELTYEKDTKLCRLFPQGHFGRDAPVIKAIEFYRGSLAQPYSPETRTALMAGISSSDAIESADVGATSAARRSSGEGRLNSSARPSHRRIARRADLILDHVWTGSAVRVALVAAMLGGGVYTALYFSGVLSLIPARHSALDVASILLPVLMAFAVTFIIMIANVSVGGIIVTLFEPGKDLTSRSRRLRYSRKARLHVSVDRWHVVLIGVLAALGCVLATIELRRLDSVRVHSKLFVDLPTGRIAVVLSLITIAVAVAALAGALNNRSRHLWLALRETSDGPPRANISDANIREAGQRLERVSPLQLCLHFGLAGVFIGGLYLGCFFSGLLHSVAAWAAKGGSNDLGVAWLGAAAFVIVVSLLVAASNLLLSRGKFRLRLAEAD